MKRYIRASGCILLFCLVSFTLISCGGNRRLYEAVCGHYSDAGISELDIYDDGSYISDAGGQKNSGEWERGKGKVNVKDGNSDYEGIPLTFIYRDSTGSECRADAVCYTDGNGNTKIQYSGVTYTRK